LVAVLELRRVPPMWSSPRAVSRARGLSRGSVTVAPTSNADKRDCQQSSAGSPDGAVARCPHLRPALAGLSVAARLGDLDGQIGNRPPSDLRDDPSNSHFPSRRWLPLALASRRSPRADLVLPGRWVSHSRCLPGRSSCRSLARCRADPSLVAGGRERETSASARGGWGGEAACRRPRPVTRLGEAGVLLASAADSRRASRPDRGTRAMASRGR
jgi:hypothetical protein